MPQFKKLYYANFRDGKKLLTVKQWRIRKYKNMLIRRYNKYASLYFRMKNYLYKSPTNWDDDYYWKYSNCFYKIGQLLVNLLQRLEYPIK